MAGDQTGRGGWWGAPRIWQGIAGSLPLWLALIPTASPAAVWPSISLTLVVSGLTEPTHVTHAGDGSGRLFVVERPGQIRIVKQGVLLPTPFLDISSRVSTVGVEQGLLSVAFPPQYATKGYFYVDDTT